MAFDVGYLLGPDEGHSHNPVKLIPNGDGTFSIAVSGAIVATIASADVAAFMAILGATNGVAVTTDANGTLQQYIRGIVKMLAAKVNVKVADGDNVVSGALADAGVGDNTGSINAHLREIARLATVTSTAFVIPITLTVTNGVYTIGDAVGGLITLPNVVSANGKRGLIVNIELAGVAALEYNLFFFASDIATPAADNAVGTMVAADIAMCKGVVPIDAAHYKAPVSAFNVATLVPQNSVLPLEYSCAARTLYAYMIARAITSPGTTTITLTVKGMWLD